MDNKANAPSPTTMYPQLPAQGQPQTVMVTHNVNVGPTPQRMSCPSCHADIQTKVENKASTKTHMIALIMCLCCCWLCACCPDCIDSCQSQRHTCPNCGAFIGMHNN